MRVLLFPFCLFACEQVPSSGNPLQPVSVAAPSASEDVTEVNDESEPPTTAEDVFTLSSEEMAAAVDASNGGSMRDSKEEERSPALEQGTSAPAPTTPPTNGVAAASTSPPVDSALSGWPTQAAKAWPVRLVTTVPNATPPRAILGLPDGREVVVNPGSMVPDLGIVVVAISPNSADLAKVAPAGDHATIESVTLTAQY